MAVSAFITCYILLFTATDSIQQLAHDVEIPSEQKSSAIVYGVMTTGSPVYTAKLMAQVRTWARGLPGEGRFFAVAGRGTSESEGEGLIVEDRCDDSNIGVPCKEERIIEEGYNRGASWLVILGEDNYVNQARLEQTLADHTALPTGNTPTALGIVGCGKGYSYCPEVDESGGFCGGGGYAINRAALQLLMAKGSDELQKEYPQTYMPGDIATSCALRRRGVQLTTLPGLGGGRMMELPKWKHIFASGGLLTYHYCTPDVMNWLNSMQLHKPEPYVSELEGIAFKEKCCCQYKTVDLLKCQQEMHTSTELQIPNGPLPLSWDDLASAYIKERDEQLSRGPPARDALAAASLEVQEEAVEDNEAEDALAFLEVPEEAVEDNEAEDALALA